MNKLAIQQDYYKGELTKDDQQSLKKDYDKVGVVNEKGVVQYVRDVIIGIKNPTLNDEMMAKCDIKYNPDNTNVEFFEKKTDILSIYKQKKVNKEIEEAREQVIQQINENKFGSIKEIPLEGSKMRFKSKKNQFTMKPGFLLKNENSDLFNEFIPASSKIIPGKCSAKAHIDKYLSIEE